MKSWTTILDDVQIYLALKITPLPVVRQLFLEKMIEEERKGKLCVLPSTRLELHHLQVQARICQKLNTLHQRVRAKAA